MTLRYDILFQHQIEFKTLLQMSLRACRYLLAFSKMHVSGDKRNCRMFAAQIALAAHMTIVRMAIASADEAVDSRDSVAAIWDRWHANTTSFNVKGYKFVGDCTADDSKFGRSDFLRLVHDQLKPLLNHAGSAPTLDELSSTTNSIFLPQRDENRPGHPVGSWRPYRFVESPEGNRVDDEVGGT